MRRRFPLLFGFLLTLLLALQPLLVQATPLKQVPAPAPASGGISAAAVGDIYYGATPPNVDLRKPVLVFVHGYNSSADTWWTNTAYHGVNDMYTYAYNNGYRTAFVSLAPDRSMWYNGSLLDQKIDTIRNHFGVTTVTVVAHSKGGVDANAASVHYGAHSKISRIVTLGSPHWGTPLADMAYSTWTWWLAAIFGQVNEATYVMQTGYMNYYRSITPTDSIPYYTFSGTKCGPVFSAMWYGCIAIGGEDDGVVPVWSARIPGGTHLKEGYWDHDEIKMGSRTWSYFAPYIQTASLDAVAAEGPLLAALDNNVTATGAAPSKAPGNVLLRGGATGDKALQSFPVETGVRQVSFTIISSSPSLLASLIGPDGKVHSAATHDQIPAGDVFAGAYIATVSVNAPAAGAWKLSATAPAQAGYLMIATLDSDVTATLEMDNSVAAPGSKKALAVGFSGARAPNASQADAQVSRAGERPHGRPSFAAQGGKHQATIDVPQGNAIHNVTVTITGTLPDGSAVERTLVTSFAAAAAKERGSWR